MGSMIWHSTEMNDIDAITTSGTFYAETNNTEKKGTP